MVIIFSTHIIVAGTVFNSKHFLFSFSSTAEEIERFPAELGVRKFETLTTPMMGKEKRFLLWSDARNPASPIPSGKHFQDITEHPFCAIQHRINSSV